MACVPVSYAAFESRRCNPVVLQTWSSLNEVLNGPFPFGTSNQVAEIFKGVDTVLLHEGVGPGSIDIGGRQATLKSTIGLEDIDARCLRHGYLGQKVLTG